MKHLNILDWATLALAVCMLGALGKWPYDYYMLLRYATMIILGAQAIRYFNAEKSAIAYTFTALVMLFQPFFKITLRKGTWNVIDVIAAILLCILVFQNKGKKE